jgi:hypothetical protein
MTQDDKIVEFPTPEEHQQRAYKKALRLASLAPGEYKLYVAEDAQALGIPVETLTGIVLDILKDRERKEKEERSRIADQRREERERKTEQHRIDKEVAQKAKES